MGLKYTFQLQSTRTPRLLLKGLWPHWTAGNPVTTIAKCLGWLLVAGLCHRLRCIKATECHEEGSYVTWLAPCWQGARGNAACRPCLSERPAAERTQPGCTCNEPCRWLHNYMGLTSEKPQRAKEPDTHITQLHQITRRETWRPTQ